MLLFYITLIEFVMFLCIRNSIKSNSYLEIAIYLLITILSISTYIWIRKKDFIKRHIPFSKKVIAFLISPICVLGLTIGYNLFLGKLYYDYLNITGIKTPLFIANAFLSNIFIYFSTLILIIGIYLLYIFSVIIFLGFLSESIEKKASYFVIIPMLFLAFQLAYIGAYVSSKYNKNGNTTYLIQNILYEYQYYDNEIIKDKKYICSQFKDNNTVRVYPIFSEEKISYVIKEKDGSYIFNITECKN